MSAAYSAEAATGGTDITGFLGPTRTRVLQLSGINAPVEEGQPIVLRNLGSKPLKLHAELLAEGANRQSGSGYWHEIALYRTESGQIAVALRLLRLLPGDLGVHRARIFEDLDGASDWLERFDTSVDVDADFDVADCRLSTASLTVQAAALRERAERLDRAYRSLVGEILFRLAVGQ